MAFWAVRAGSGGEREAFALENNCVVVGWDDLSDLSKFATRTELKNAVSAAYLDLHEGKLSVWTGQLWAFSHEIKEGDLVALPRKHSGTIAFGTIAGNYRFNPKAPAMAQHQRPVRWIDQDFPRLRLDEDIRFSLGAILTVFQVRRNDAEERMRAILEGRTPKIEPSALDVLETEFINIERQARDRIISHIGRKFRAHELERLVEAVLQAQGFITDRTPPGADGGVDILAGRGLLGFDPPRLAVQVKSSETPVDVSSVRELQGVMRAFGADLGLFVAWGGFRGTAPRDARRDFFQLRLWDAEDLLDQILQLYEKLPSDIQAELPLKQVWTLVEEGADD
ncbi:MAG: restriction endonuclease [Xanthobacteraceae bacterium]